MTAADDEISPEFEEFEEAEAARLLLRRLLVATGWRHQELDAKLGFAPGSTSRLLAGDTPLQYGQVARILRAIQVEPHFFFDALQETRPVARGALGSADFRRQARHWGLDEAVETDVPLRGPGPAADPRDPEQRVLQAIHGVLSRQGGSKREPD